jgi:hypothetical protein
MKFKPHQWGKFDEPKALISYTNDFDVLAGSLSE